MKSTRTLLMIGIALVAGLIAAFLAVRWLDSQARARVAAAPQGVKVAIAAQDLRVGVELSEKAIQLIDWPSGSTPPGAARDTESLIGRTVKTPILKGEPILDGKITAKGERGGIAAVLAPGKRAISVGVNDVIGMSGEMLEGSYVDVIVNSTESADGDRQRSISKIVLERVRILAVSQSQPNSGRVNGVTLEVTPGEAEKLDLARSVGNLSLMLRSQAEEGEAATKGATKDALFGNNRPAVQPQATSTARPVVTRETPKPQPPVLPAPAPAAPAKVCVDAFVGSERRSECF